MRRTIMRYVNMSFDIVYGLNASEETVSNAGLLGWRGYVFQVQLSTHNEKLAEVEN